MKIKFCCEWMDIEMSRGTLRVDSDVVRVDTRQSSLIINCCPGCGNKIKTTGPPKPKKKKQ